jgi:hypothetical protein
MLAPRHRRRAYLWRATQEPDTVRQPHLSLPSPDDRGRWGWLAGLAVTGAPITTKVTTSPMPFCHFMMPSAMLCMSLRPIRRDWEMSRAQTRLRGRSHAKRRKMRKMMRRRGTAAYTRVVSLWELRGCGAWCVVRGAGAGIVDPSVCCGICDGGCS